MVGYGVALSRNRSTGIFKQYAMLVLEKAFGSKPSLENDVFRRSWRTLLSFFMGSPSKNSWSSPTPLGLPGLCLVSSLHPEMQWAL